MEWEWRLHWIQSQSTLKDGKSAGSFSSTGMLRIFIIYFWGGLMRLVAIFFDRRMKVTDVLASPSLAALQNNL